MAKKIIFILVRSILFLLVLAYALIFLLGNQDFLGTAITWLLCGCVGILMLFLVYLTITWLIDAVKNRNADEELLSEKNIKDIIVTETKRMKAVSDEQVNDEKKRAAAERKELRRLAQKQKADRKKAEQQRRQREQQRKKAKAEAKKTGQTEKPAQQSPAPANLTETQEPVLPAYPAEPAAFQQNRPLFAEGAEEETLWAGFETPAEVVNAGAGWEEKKHVEEPETAPSRAAAQPQQSSMPQNEFDYLKASAQPAQPPPTAVQPRQVPPSPPHERSQPLITYSAEFHPPTVLENGAVVAAASLPKKEAPVRQPEMPDAFVGPGPQPPVTVYAPPIIERPPVQPIAERPRPAAAAEIPPDPLPPAPQPGVTAEPQPTPQMTAAQRKAQAIESVRRQAEAAAAARRRAAQTAAMTHSFTSQTRAAAGFDSQIIESVSGTGESRAATQPPAPAQPAAQPVRPPVAMNEGSLWEQMNVRQSAAPAVSARGQAVVPPAAQEQSAAGAYPGAAQQSAAAPYGRPASPNAFSPQSSRAAEHVQPGRVVPPAASRPAAKPAGHTTAAYGPPPSRQGPQPSYTGSPVAGADGQPAKRPRGRPPKPKTEEELNQPKRPRGRPPKPKTQEELNQPKRPRGRPPKPKTEEELNKPKRPRGRPRKYPLPDNPLPSAQGPKTGA